ncbi:MAG TPA: hypothetical protein VF571_16455, partial [Pyrinomonadaceae bacterium]
REIATNYEGDPALYFYGIARKVSLEAHRKKPEVPATQNPFYLPVFDEDSEENYQRRNCLNRCLVELPNDDRSIVVQYYASEERTNIDHRHQLALECRLTLNTLRVRAHRIRQRLQKCVEACLEKNKT